MNPKFLTIFLFSSLIHVAIFCQNYKIKFHSLNSVGIIFGKSKESISIESVNGIKYKNWFTGIGLGVDYYQNKSYPLFIDARKYFWNKEKVFAFADIGYNISANNSPGTDINYFTSYKLDGGIYSAIGLGLRMKISKGYSLLISTGYSYKQMQGKYTVINPCLTGVCPKDYYTFIYGYGRILLKAGIGF